MSKVKCMNPWDPQSKRQYQIDGVYCALNAGQAIGGQAHGVCYCIEGNVVDRISRKNGKGWCEDVSPTLNTQDRHAVCFESNDAIAFDGYNIDTNEQAFKTITSGRNDTHNIPVTCYAIEGNGARPSHLGRGYHDDGTMYTLNTIEQHSVCYEEKNESIRNRAPRER